MQFFYLFSFVVAASYAAALPQPAGLYEKYSNSVDTTLTSGLQARSYQPGSNSQKDSATLVSLKRRDDSDGSSGENSESDPSPPPATTPNEPFSDPFTDDMIISKNLSSTINNVGDGDADIFKDGELVGQKIEGPVGDMVARYLRRAAYVNVALGRWERESVSGMLGLIQSGLGEDEYFKVEPEVTEKIKDLKDGVNSGVNAMVDATSKILGEVGSVIESVKNTRKSFKLIFESRKELLWVLITQLEKFTAGRTLELELFGIVTSLDGFLAEQKKLYKKIMKKLKAKYPQ
ncbi:hypothetical protein BASA50_011337 [Batrachochytrium salamandrivorans]|uniref:Secreted protein n=1 Tax=Batrachochytrium salamandrivorans TaxID=1357716 RepID=A0ABQ8EYM1_9FUNG|nr:hypothetical protein BASA60_000712 [Batrachochytrium salamandrivorans]KAH6587476.1 hypothetical protein BASA50_011337 [Batrachochytrium salamandrivorans]KAH9246341.1 hypothetical protein BASA81_016103 [Batrachochytrium salamandrivorans]